MASSPDLHQPRTRARRPGWAALPKPAPARSPDVRALVMVGAPMSQGPGHPSRSRPDTAARTAAPGVPVAAPAPGAGALGGFASGMGNASFSRAMGGGSAIARTPAAAVAQPPADAVTSALARSVQQRRVARAGEAPAATEAGASTANGPSSAIPDDPAPIAPAHGRPGGQRPPGAGQAVLQGARDEVPAGSPQMLRLQTHLFPGVFVTSTPACRSRPARGQPQPRAEPREGRGDDATSLRHRVGQRRRQRPARRAA